jgi:hypothetical protein
MPRNSLLDDMRAELVRRRRRHAALCLAAGKAEADYRHARAVKIRDERVAGSPATMCEYLADADPKIYELHKARLSLAGRERAVYEACKDLRALISGEQTQAVNDRDV